MASTLSLSGITKRFGSVLANDDVSLEVRGGSVHALVGENGAGKSTLMKIAYGLHRPDAGEVLVDDVAITGQPPRTARSHGVGMVHQHFSLAASMTVTENMLLGEPSWRLDFDEARRRVRAISERYRMPVDPDAVVGNLPVSIQQRVEILRAFFNEAGILIFDEPTSVLSHHETQELLARIDEFRRDGKAVLFISHKLPEVMAIADEVTVMRRGRVVHRAAADQTDEADLVRHMVGDFVSHRHGSSVPSRRGSAALEVDGLVVDAPESGTALDDVALTVRSGEVVGIAAIAGNGQTELVRALTGLAPVRAGSVRANGVEVTHLDVAGHRAGGVAHMPADRLHEGINRERSVFDNIALRLYRDPEYRRGLFLRRGAMQRRVQELVEEYSIRVPSAAVPAGALSGGNQQRVIAARELLDQPGVVIAEEPTWGLDVQAAEFLYGQLASLKERGAGILVVSSDLDELLEIADTIVVLYRGRVAGTVPAEEATVERLGAMMTGAA
ncbi:MAG: ABC transporter ATP-binding protein [Nocardioidaceae bacterium]|nr:ABC transporter ATP-binding protein [Nocardioidaceae bacterium]